MVLLGLQGPSSLLMRVINQALTDSDSQPRLPGGLLPPLPGHTRHLAQICRRSMVRFQGRQDRWAGASLFVWTTSWCTRRRWSSTCSALRRCSRSSVVGSSMPRDQVRVRAAGGRLPGPPTLQVWRVRGPTQGAVRSRVGYVDVVLLDSCTEMLRFMGLASYYRRFVEGYTEIVALLTALGSPTARFAWSTDAQAIFDAL